VQYNAAKKKKKKTKPEWMNEWNSEIVKCVFTI
jgi:hypothetical protein